MGNTGGYGYRGHYCYVKPKSAQCKNTKDAVDRNSNWLWGVREIGGVNYDVPAYKFECADAKGDPNGKPYWQRTIKKAEGKLVIRATASRKRRDAGYRRWKKKQQRARLDADQAESEEILSEFCTRDDESYNLCRMSKPDIDRAAKRRAMESVDIMCQHHCQHPNVWSDDPISFGAYSNVDYQRGGKWVCWYEMIDAAGNNQVVTRNEDDENPLPEGSWCKLHCPGTGDDDTSAIHCESWNQKHGFKQYNRDEVRDLANFFASDGWTCT